MLAPHTMSEKMRMKEMVVRSRACVPLPVSPSVREMIMAMRKLSAAANIFVPKVFRIFLNTGLLIINGKNSNNQLFFQILPLQLSLSAPVTEANTLVFPSNRSKPRKAKTKASL